MGSSAFHSGYIRQLGARYTHSPFLYSPYILSHVIPMMLSKIDEDQDFFFLLISIRKLPVIPENVKLHPTRFDPNLVKVGRASRSFFSPGFHHTPKPLSSRVNFNRMSTLLLFGSLRRRKKEENNNKKLL